MANKPTDSPSKHSSESLLDFAQKQTRAQKCFFCTITEVEEVNEAIRSKRISYPIIVRWLKEEKHYDNVTLPKLKYHIAGGHMNVMKDQS